MKMLTFLTQTFVKYFALSLALCLLTVGASAQQPEMADGLRAEGKIYVVVAIIVIILIGFVAYLFLLDRKVRHLENLIREKTSK